MACVTVRGKPSRMKPPTQVRQRRRSLTTSSRVSSGTVSQAKVLDLLLESNDLALDAVVLYDLATALIVPRLVGRRICPTCQRFYHVKYRPPRISDTCDDCQTTLVQLTDDRIDSIRLLSGHYTKNSQPLISYYRGA